MSIKISGRLHICMLALALMAGGVMAWMYLATANPVMAARSVGYNGKFVFDSRDDSDHQVYTVNADGTGLQVLTSDGVSDTASWSPDGSKILFETDRDGNFEVYTMNADGSNQTRLTNSVGYDGSSVWSPDGSKILFQSDRSGNDDIFVMNADGSGQTNLTNLAGSDDMFKWSPDGSKILFRHLSFMYMMNSDGSNQHRVTAATGSERDWDWSPDGSKIVFDRSPAGDQIIYVIDADGSDLTQVSADLGAYNPHWSPDGQLIAFVAYYGGQYGVNVATVNGDGTYTALHQSSSITPDANYAENVYWSADGTRLALEVDENSWNEGNTYTMKPDFSDVISVTSAYAGDYGYYADWQAVPNQAPVAQADSLTVAHDTAGSVAVLANDSDEEALSGNNLSITVQPSHGTATVVTATGHITYTPTTGYAGTDTFTYRICDSFSLDQKCATAVATMTVQVAGDSSPTVTLTKVGTQMTAGGDGSYQYNGSRPTFSGTATAGATITVEIHSDPIILTTTADGDGNWSVTADQDIPAGTHTVLITATKDGVTTTLDQFVLGISLEIPDTGTASWPWAVAGIGLVTLGGIVSYSWRRRFVA